MTDISEHAENHDRAEYPDGCRYCYDEKKALRDDWAYGPADVAEGEL